MLRYRCDRCGREQEEGERWLALRISGDRRGIEIRALENSAPDDRIFCGETCAFARLSEILAARGSRPA